MEQQIIPTNPPGSILANEVPQSGPAMLRHALQAILEASDKGQISGLYGPLHGYVARALAQPEDPTKAAQFVEQVASMSIWSFDQDDGEPYKECEEPSDGFLDSHCTLMQLIEKARKIPSAPAADTRAITTIPVAYWDSTHYNPDGDGETKGYQIEIDDQRRSNGQAFVTVAALDGNLDDMLSCTFEVNRLPESTDDLPCCHVHFDNDNLAVSLFKKGDQIIVRPEADVSITDTVLPNGKRAWLLE